MRKTAVVFAPATIANVAVGFDILGFPIESVGDQITVERVEVQQGQLPVSISEIQGVETALPKDPAQNTATVGLLQLVKDLKLTHGFRVSIRKGIPLGSGMGGSAASSVGALVAANALLDVSLSKDVLLKYALMGEYVASGSAHPDNVAPCLYGGLTLVSAIDPIATISIPFPAEIICVLVHPHIRLDTRVSRSVLKPEIPMTAFVRQSANLAGFIAGCFQKDLKQIAKSLQDVIVEPQRAALIPGFHSVKKAAIQAGALGCSISGSGPSIFAWTKNSEVAAKVRNAMMGSLKNENVEADSWISPVSQQGARLI